MFFLSLTVSKTSLFVASCQWSNKENPKFAYFYLVWLNNQHSTALTRQYYFLSILHTRKWNEKQNWQKIKKNYGQGQYREKFYRRSLSSRQAGKPKPVSFFNLFKKHSRRKFAEKKTFFTYLVYDYAFIQVSCASYLRTLMLLYKMKLRLSKFMTQTSHP